MKQTLLVFLFFFSFNLYSQNTKVIDSLLIEVGKNTKDTLLINYYYLIASEYISIDLAKSDYYTAKVLHLSKKCHYPQGYAFYYFLKSKKCYTSGQYQKGLQYVSIAKKYVVNSRQSEIFLDLIYIQALCYIGQSKYSMSIEVCENALRFLPKNCTKYNQMGRLYATIAGAYTRNNQFEQSLKFLPVAISYFRKASNVNGELLCYIELHDINFLSENHDKAHEAIIEALQIYQNNNLKSLSFLVSIQYKIGESFSRKNQFKSAIAYFKSALKLNETLNNSFEEYTILGLLAEAYCYSNQFEKCIETINMANKITIDDELGRQFSFYLLAKSYYGLKNYKKAKNYIDKAISNVLVLKNKGNNDYNEKAYFELSAAVEYDLGNFKTAYLQVKKYSELEINHLKSEKAKRIDFLQEQFQLKEKDIKLKNMLLYKQEKELELLNTKKMMVYLYVFISLLLIGVILFFIFYRIKIKNNLLLQMKNAEIDKKNSDLFELNENLVSLLAEKEVLLKEMHHRVKNNLLLVVSLLNIQSRVSRHPIVDEFIEKSQSRILSMSLIHQNLYNTKNVSRIYFQNYLDELVQNLLLAFNNTLVKASVRADNIFFDIQTALPLGLIINEILTNSLKHAFNDGEVGELSISLHKDADQFVLLIGDNGKGIANLCKRKDAIGMDLVELLVMQLKGELHLLSENGTQYKIIFREPLKP